MLKRVGFVIVMLVGVAVFTIALTRESGLPAHAPAVGDTNIIKEAQPAAPSAAVKQRIRSLASMLPMSFEENRGQIDPAVKFASRGSGYTLYFTSSELLMSLGNAQRVERLRVFPVGAAAGKLTGVDPREGKSNYFRAGKSVTDIPMFSRVRHDDVYPGVSLMYYGNQRNLEYDFVVAPDADTRQIKVGYQGAQKMALNADGELVLTFKHGVMTSKKPLVYQETGSGKSVVDGKFVLLETPTAANDFTGLVGFEVAAYDRNQTLVIDPVLSYSTLLGDAPDDDGDGVFLSRNDDSGDDHGNGIAVDSAGNAYIVGQTNAFDFPVLNNFQTLNQSVHPLHPPDDPVGHGQQLYDAFVVKMNPTGTSVLSATYIGGTNNDNGLGVAVNSLGQIYVTGTTTSTEFPILNALQGSNAGNQDAFLVKIAAGGNSIIFSTYLGGSGIDSGNAIAIDPSGNVYVCGSTTSTNFRTAFPLQAANAGGTDAFVAKFTPDGGVLTYGTYLGGVGNDSANSIISDSSGNAYIAGSTASANFPLVASFQTQLNGASDAFVTKINAGGTILVYSTFLGGAGTDFANGITVDSQSNCYVTGGTTSTDFPTQSPSVLPVQTLNGGMTDAFVTKFAQSGASLIFSTYFGGNNVDIGRSITVDARGAIYFVGSTASTTGFPLAPASNTLQTGLAGGLTDGFIGKFNPTGVPAVYATYFGSVSTDEARAVAVDSNGNAYVTGYTEDGFSTTFGAFQTIKGEDFPTRGEVGFTGANQGTVEQGDAYISKIVDSSPIITSTTVAAGQLNVLFNYQIVATNSPTAYNAAGLPPGLVVNTAGGGISGTPSATGTFNVVLIASNASGTGAQQLKLTISGGVPVINSSLAATAIVGEIFTYNITASNDPSMFSTGALPTGLALDAQTGLISGIPVTEGTLQISIRAENPLGFDQKLLTLTVVPSAPVITSSANAQGVFNQAFSYFIGASNNPTSYTAGPLPSWASINTSTGVISGTPTGTGTFNVTVTATNAGGTGTMQLTISIIPPASPDITSATSATVVRGVAFEYDIIATNNPIVFDTNVALPAGLTLDNATGVISGTTTVAASMVTVQLQATNSFGSDFQNLVLNIVDPPVTVVTSPNSVTGIESVTFEYDIAATNNPISFAITGGALPAGVVLTPGTNRIQGTPTATGPFSATITPTNLAGAGTPFVLSITINPLQTPVITSPVNPQATVGIPFSYQITATQFPSSFNVVGLPANGLSVNASGLITGTPAAAGNVVLTVAGVNSAGTGTNRTITINVQPPQVPVITNSPLTAVGIDGAAFAYTVTATGSGPITYSATLPATLAINATTGIITGTLSGAGPLNIPITATNSVGSDNETLVVNVSAAPPAITNSQTILTGQTGQPFNFTITAVGTAPITYSASILPPGLTLSGATISGTPTSAAVGSSSVVLTATNSIGSNNKTITINIAPQAPTIVGSLSVSAAEGSLFTYTIQATGGLPQTFAAAPLPSWLTLTGNTLSGTPSAVNVGTAMVGLTVTNLSGSDTKTLTISVASRAPGITSSLAVNATPGQPFAYTITATGATPMTFGASPLPAGLIFDGVNTINGTPVNTGTANITLTATNAFGTDTQILVLTVAQGAPSVISSLALTGAVGNPFTYNILASGATPITFTTSALPPGLSLSGSTISGTPTTAGVFTVTLTSTNAFGTVQQTLLITITGADRDGDGVLDNVDTDIDGDGFPNEVETTFGFNPNDATSTPFGGQPAGTNQVLNITNMSIKLNFIKTAADSISIKGTLPFAAGATVGNKQALIFVGGIARTITLDDKGSGKLGSDKIKISVKGGIGTFSVTLAKDTFASFLADEGLIPNATVTNEAKTVNVYILVNNTLYFSSKVLSYSAKAGKSGSAKVAR
jgi:PKD repeat protein